MRTISPIKLIFSALLPFALLLTTMNASAAEIIHMSHIEILGAYSDIRKSATDFGQEVSAFWAPVIKLSDTYAVIPLIDVHLERVQQYLPEEEGNRFSNTYLTTNVSVAARKEFSPGWFVKASGLGTGVFMKETHTDRWGKGLYDYTDVGAALELEHEIVMERSKTTMAGGFEIYRRKYPNFHTLISETTVTPPEKDEKDYDGYKYRMRFDQLYASGFSWYANPYYLDKFYVDKHLVNDDGTLDLSKNRKDYEISMDFGVSQTLPFWKRVKLSLDNSLTRNRSNMDFYDSRSTLSLSDDKFTPNYYAYDSAVVGPSLEYAHPLSDEKVLRLKAGYSYLYRRYMDRKAQMIDGTYTPEDQIDKEKSYTLSAYIPITKNLSWLTKYTYTNVESNMKYEAFYRYNYGSHQVKSGISLDF